MKKAWILTFAILCVLCLVSCLSVQEGGVDATVVPGDSIEREETSLVEDSAMGEETQAANSTLEDTDPSGSGSGEPEAITPEPVDECLNCHTDKQMLIDTAEPLEVVESENEGEG